MKQTAFNTFLITVILGSIEHKHLNASSPSFNTRRVIVKQLEINMSHDVDVSNMIIYELSYL